MSLDRSLKTGGALARHRNVLTRSERIARLQDRGRFDPAAGDPLHLPKVGNRKIAAGGKSAKKEAAPAEAAAVAPAASAAPAAGAAKGGAGAAKGGAGAAKSPAATPPKGAAPGKGAKKKK